MAGFHRAHPPPLIYYGAGAATELHRLCEWARNFYAHIKDKEDAAHWGACTQHSLLVGVRWEDPYELPLRHAALSWLLPRHASTP